MTKCNITPDMIDNLNANDVFVFGSNLAGAHGAGAAKWAHERFGAKTGIGVGFSDNDGKTYALPTKDFFIETLPLEVIKDHVDKLFFVARAVKQRHFLITKIGCGLAGYTISEIAPMFKDFLTLDNVSLPQEFIDHLESTNEG